MKTAGCVHNFSQFSLAEGSAWRSQAVTLAVTFPLCSSSTFKWHLVTKLGKRKVNVALR